MQAHVRRQRGASDLLQLLILQVASHHHLQHDEQFPVADVSIPIDVIDLEREAQLLLLIALGAECAEARHEFLEIDVASAVFVEDGYHSARQRGHGQQQGTGTCGLETPYRVARGFDETCGRERNSSRSIVPELSCPRSA